ncbi:PREDICTED: uncharacterized protein LOC105557288 [Vollenhovia emeryi]|uniref:uncharacterized protein LOC105557288 n=1 Tax=Vollenhovia emeryi TaxID=411798 RepID=UPI0005F5514A|nr:PREDICTED: uncharacterized protein LOC105557288 [Vollenhovia emeryi]
MRNPDTSWKQFPIVLKHQYSTYNNARKALVKAEEETNIDSNVSDCEVPRKKKRPIRFESDDSDNDVFPKRCQTSTIAVSDSEDDLNQENAKSVVRDKVQSMLNNVSFCKRKPFSEQSLNRISGEQNKNNYTILKKINSDNKGTKHIIVENPIEGNVKRKYQHIAEYKKSNLCQEKSTTLSCKTLKYRSAKNAYEHDSLVNIGVADRGSIKDIRDDISAKNADVDDDNNEELVLTRSASVLSSRGFTSPSNRSDDNFDIQNSHSLTIDDASPGI